MIIPRREFLKMLGVAAGAAGMGGCGSKWLVPDDLVELAQRGPGLESSLQTICGLCEGGCGMTVRLVDGLPVGLKGNPRHPLNRGGLCPVGEAGLEVLYAPHRLEGPLRRQADGEFVPVGWEEALTEIVARLEALMTAGEGHRFALMTDEPGQLFWELATRFSNTLGSPNIARSAGSGALPFYFTQGIDETPGYDLASADLVLSFGLDLYEDGPAPVHAISAMVGSRSTEDRGVHLQVGTRLSPSAAKAEEYYGIEPGSYGAFALGIAQVLVREGRYARDFVDERTFGFEDWTDGQGRVRQGFRRLLLERYYSDRAAQLCGCEPGQIVRAARRLARASAPVVVLGGDATQGSNATATAIAIHSLNALLGAFDRPGGVVLAPPVPLTPLAPIEPASETPSLFSSPGTDSLGIDPVEALVERVLDGPADVDVLFVITADPVLSSPAGQRLRQALEKIPLVVSFAQFRDETAAAADLILPSPTFLESWQGATTPATVAFSILGLGKPVIEPLFDSRHPGDVLLDLGRRLGGSPDRELPWSTYQDYLKQRLEGLVVSGEGSIVTGSFEDSWVHFLEARGWRFLEHRNIEDFWAEMAQEAGWWNPVLTKGDWGRLFQTPSGRFEFFSQILEERLGESDDDAAFLPHFEPLETVGAGDLTLIPFRPITARGGLSAVSPMVLEMFGYPFLDGWQTWAELAPETAHDQDLGDGDVVAVESDRGSVEAVVRVQPGTTAGTVHMPVGLGHQEDFGVGGGVGANPIELVLPARDSLAGNLSRASTRVRLRLLRRRPHGGPPPMDGGHGA